MCLFFFFSSRRRHTRCSRDWSSDVCSSDLTPQNLLAAHVTEAPEAINRRRASLPPALAALVMRCLEKRPADRPQSASAVVHALDDITTPSGGMTPTGTQASR